MSTANPIIEDPDLGLLTRAETTLDGGETVIHDWYASSIRVGDHEVEVVIDGDAPESVRALLPRARTVVTEIDSIRRHASDAILTRFSDGEPSDADLDTGAADLLLDVIEVTTTETVLHFSDACGQHFPEGYWPAAHLGPDGNVIDVTVES